MEHDDVAEKQHVMEEALQGIIDNTEVIIEAIGSMEWARIEDLAESIATFARCLRIISGRN